MDQTAWSSPSSGEFSTVAHDAEPVYASPTPTNLGGATDATKEKGKQFAKGDLVGFVDANKDGVDDRLENR